MFVRTRDFDHEMADLRAELKMLSESIVGCITNMSA